jgi:hypothetical protein
MNGFAPLFKSEVGDSLLSFNQYFTNQFPLFSLERNTKAESN